MLRKVSYLFVEERSFSNGPRFPYTESAGRNQNKGRLRTQGNGPTVRQGSNRGKVGTAVTLSPSLTASSSHFDPVGVSKILNTECTIKEPLPVEGNQRGAHGFQWFAREKVRKQRDQS